MMRVINLTSGSKGNITYVGTDKYNMLIDVGLSGKKINQLLLTNVGIDLDDIDLVFITHAHSDHIMSFNMIYNKYPKIKFVVDKQLKQDIEVYTTKHYDDERFIFVNGYSKGKHTNIGNFHLHHDSYCLGWVIEEVDGDSLCFIADNGMYPYKLLEEPLLQKPYTYYMIESNYDEFLQYTDTTRNELLKRRVLSTKGHSSNLNAVEKAVKLLSVTEPHKCKGVMFTHLSEHCNNEDLAKASHNAYITVWGKKTLFKNVKISYARQNEVIEI